MEEHTMSLDRVNKIALIILLPAAAILITPFILLYGFETIKSSEITFKNIAGGSFLMLAIFIAGGAVHELLHGIFWSIYAKKRWKAISFGIKWEYLTPYCHCDEPLRKDHFMLGALMPFLVLGVVPLLLSYFSGSFRLWFFGYFFTVAALGDLLAVKMLWNTPKKSMIQDHPSELGFIVEKSSE